MSSCPKWFPPQVDEEEILRVEKKKTNKLAIRVRDRITYIVSSKTAYDDFPIIFHDCVRSETAWDFAMELKKYVESIPGYDGTVKEYLPSSVVPRYHVTLTKKE